MKSYKIENKRGQFYLMAAIIIIAVILGFVGVKNYVKKTSDVKLYDLKEELGIESEKVIEYGKLELNDDQNEQLLEHFTAVYTEYSGEEKQLYFIFGSCDKIIAYTYEEDSSGSVSLPGVGGGSGITLTQTVKKGLCNPNEPNKYNCDNACVGKEVQVIINNQQYSFDLNQGEAFYFVISEKVGDDTHIIGSDDSSLNTPSE